MVQIKKKIVKELWKWEWLTEKKKKKKKADDWNKKWIFFFSTKGNKKNETVHKFTNEKQKKKQKTLG